MYAQEDYCALRDPLLDRIMRQLGISRNLQADLDGLRAVYRSWCENVPFDNVRKMVALRATENHFLPGGNAEEFFENWLAHGTGGTCWPTSNALYELVCALGFHARRVAGAMRDLGLVNHASVKVRIDGRDWLIDSSMLTNEPLPLGEQIFAHRDPVFAAEVEPSNGTHVLWFDSPPNTAWLPCRLVLDPVDHAYYLSAYEGTRSGSPFNQRLYARRNRPDELLVLLGRTRFSKTGKGLESRDLSREELCRSLCEDIGLSDFLVEKWASCGALDASFEEPSGPKPPPITNKPPSQRQSVLA